MQVQLNALSLAGVWSDVEKPQQDMVFFLIVLSLTAGCERVFGLTAVWAHPYQAHFQILEEVAHKLVLLVDDSMDWPYTFIWLNDAVSNVPLSNEGPISAMRDGAPSMDDNGWLHQL